MTAWQNLLTRPGPDDHFVQLYDDDLDLARNVVRYLKDGVDRGDCMIIVSTAAHLDLFSERGRKAGIDFEELRRAGKLMLLDARATLSSLLVDGLPDSCRFETLVSQRIRECRTRAAGGGVRAYGEMVNLLWHEGKPEAALRLEELWNELLKTEKMGLFCSYAIDLLKDHGAPLRKVICSHSHLLPVDDTGGLARALDRALGEVLGVGKAAALMPLIRANHFPRVRVPAAEAAVIWLRHNLPPFADEVLSRARHYLKQECATS
jgi:hypothetical protein